MLRADAHRLTDAEFNAFNMDAASRTKSRCDQRGTALIECMEDRGSQKLWLFKERLLDW